jgi:hypothetical protein
MTIGLLSVPPPQKAKIVKYQAANELISPLTPFVHTVRKTNGGKEQNASQRDVKNTEEQTDPDLQMISELTASFFLDIQSCVIDSSCSW